MTNHYKFPSTENKFTFDNDPVVKLANYDPINPNHYKWIEGIECHEVIGNFNCFLGMAIKYIWRCGRKPDVSSVQDLRKAIKYLELEIIRLEKQVDHG